MRFGLDGLQPAHRATADRALARCDFPFAERGGDVLVPVEFADLSRYTRAHAVDVRGHDDDNQVAVSLG